MPPHSEAAAPGSRLRRVAERGAWGAGRRRGLLGAVTAIRSAPASLASPAAVAGVKSSSAQGERQV